MAGEELLSALKWQLESGADEAIGEQPVNRNADLQAAPREPRRRAAVPKPSSRAPNIPPAQSAPPMPPQSQSGDTFGAANAYVMAAAAETLDDIAAVLKAYHGCPLSQTATNLVYYDGTPKARIIFIGEAPGVEEDRQGLPFVGPAGRLLDRMLSAIGLDRSRVLITNTLFWRPPGNRNPTPAEVAACLPFVERTIEIVNPEILVMVGGTAAKTLLARSEGIMKLRGKWFQFETPRMVRPIPARAIFHPAFLLRTPGQKRATWHDLIEIKKRLDENA